MGDYWKENNLEKPQQVVVCAACRNGSIIAAGARHFDKVMLSQMRAIYDDGFLCRVHRWEDGFIDQFGDFLTRKEAMVVAKNAGQKIDIKRGCGGNENILFSEGLY